MQGGDGSGCFRRGCQQPLETPALLPVTLGRWGSGEPGGHPAPRCQHTWGREASARAGQGGGPDLAGPPTHKSPSDQPTYVYWESAENRAPRWALGDQRSIPQPQASPLGAWVLTGLPSHTRPPRSPADLPPRAALPLRLAGPASSPPLLATLPPGSSLRKEAVHPALQLPRLGAPALPPRSPGPPLPHPTLARATSCPSTPPSSPGHRAAADPILLSVTFSRTQVRGRLLLYLHC